jgi:SAM-dependent methyltransferase|tara:strand:+ start:1630 stop:2442 length:813 start_codon:yes stop_codon:yes gene_type:complete
VLLCCPVAARGQIAPVIIIGQEGKDVPWVPTPNALVDTMLDMAGVTGEDFVIDLGSGDGRTVIAAAQRGARALGVELEPNLVATSRQRAIDAGVEHRTEFLAADLFTVDLTPATVITMFLLPDINSRLRPTLLGLAPGTRIVSNTWDMGGSDSDPNAPGWIADETVVLDPCPGFCTALFWIVPANVDGTWRIDGQEGDVELTFEQQFQMAAGRLRGNGRTQDVEEGRLRGREISFRVGDARYRGQVNGTEMTGTVRRDASTTAWRARKTR